MRNLRRIDRIFGYFGEGGVALISSEYLPQFPHFCRDETRPRPGEGLGLD